MHYIIKESCIFPINLPARNPFWFSWMRVSRTVFNRLAMMPENSLYVVLSNEIGRQFFKNSRGLLPFGKIDIIPSFCVLDRYSTLQLWLNDLNMNVPRSFQKNLKNSDEKPSVPGDLSGLQFFNTFKISVFVISASRIDCCSKVSFGTSIFSRRVLRSMSSSSWSRLWYGLQ